MAKLIVTNDYAQTNLLIELNDGTQVEIDVHKGELLEALKENEQTTLMVQQNQPERRESVKEVRKQSSVMDVVKKVGNYLIVRYYANTLYTNDDKVNGKPYYGDIYLTKDEVLADHPHAEILEGYGLIDIETTYQPDDADDWYESVEDVIRYIENQ